MGEALFQLSDSLRESLGNDRLHTRYEAVVSAWQQLTAALSAMSRDDAGVVTEEMVEAGRAVTVWTDCLSDDEMRAIYTAMHSARTPVREDVVKRLVEVLQKAKAVITSEPFYHFDGELSEVAREIDEALSSVGGEG